MLATGMTHLTAVSGSNVAIVSELVLGLAPCRLAPPAPAPAGRARPGRLRHPRPTRAERPAGRGMGAVGLLGLAPARGTRGPRCWPRRRSCWSLTRGWPVLRLRPVGAGDPRSLLFARPWGEAVRCPAALAPSRLRPRARGPLAAQVACGPVIVAAPGLGQPGRGPRQPARGALCPAGDGGRGPGGSRSSPVRAAAHGSGVGRGPAGRVIAVAPRCRLPGGPCRGPVAPRRPRARRPLGARCSPAVRSSAAVAAPPGAAPVPVRRGSRPPPGCPPGCRLATAGLGDGDLRRRARRRAASWRRRPATPSSSTPARTPPVDRCLDRLGSGTLDPLVLTHDHADHVEACPGRSWAGGRRAARLPGARAGERGGGPSTGWPREQHVPVDGPPRGGPAHPR